MFKQRERGITPSDSDVPSAAPASPQPGITPAHTVTTPYKSVCFKCHCSSCHYRKALLASLSLSLSGSGRYKLVTFVQEIVSQRCGFQSFNFPSDCLVVSLSYLTLCLHHGVFSSSAQPRLHFVFSLVHFWHVLGVPCVSLLRASAKPFSV